MSKGPWIKKLPVIQRFKMLRVPYPADAGPVEKGQWLLAEASREREEMLKGMVTTKQAQMSLAYLNFMRQVELTMVLPAFKWA